MDVDQDIIVPDLRFRRVAKSQCGLLPIPIDEKCFHGGLRVCFDAVCHAR
jgi:hypothetical protein